MTPQHLPTKVRLKEILQKLGELQTGTTGEQWYRLPYYFKINPEGKIVAYHEDHLPLEISKLTNVK